MGLSKIPGLGSDLYYIIVSYLLQPYLEYVAIGHFKPLLQTAYRVLSYSLPDDIIWRKFSVQKKTSSRICHVVAHSICHDPCLVLLPGVSFSLHTPFLLSHTHLHGHSYLVTSPLSTHTQLAMPVQSCSVCHGLTPAHLLIICNQPSI